MKSDFSEGAPSEPEPHQKLPYGPNTHSSLPQRPDQEPVISLCVDTARLPADQVGSQ